MQINIIVLVMALFVQRADTSAEAVSKTELSIILRTYNTV
ncbi:hypothetical protein SD77_2951 [Bacillus badius]|uniref:Uncharacterized protein n=1 Tax=Bacillus badius TaxID=1455 RepID=A0ABR5AP75_BACBA|nr:hypothetical protein SD77_2951 [Bacillus badius]KIL74779.1 hypothetical protein SD78_1848 [Bacillus badius]